MTPDHYDALWQHQAALNERLTAAIEHLTTQQVETHSLLASLNTKYQRVDVSLASIVEALGKHTGILERLEALLQRHEATFERLGRLLDERLPRSGNGTQDAPEEPPHV